MAVGSVSEANLRAWLNLGADIDQSLISQVAVATDDWVNALPYVSEYGSAPDTDPWPADVALGAVMLAARLYRRRNSPAGIDAITDAGIAYVARSDSDVASLLRLAVYQPPAIA